VGGEELDGTASRGVMQQQQQFGLSEEELQRLADAFAAALPAAVAVADAKPEAAAKEQGGEMQQEQQTQQAPQSDEGSKIGTVAAVAEVVQCAGRSKPQLMGSLTGFDLKFDPDEECGVSRVALQGQLMTWKRDPWGAVGHVGSVV
jgi:hypothetical protein